MLRLQQLAVRLSSQDSQPRKRGRPNFVMASINNRVGEVVKSLQNINMQTLVECQRSVIGCVRQVESTQALIDQVLNDAAHARNLCATID